MAGRADDVAEQDRQQLALGDAPPPAGEELLDLAEQRRAVADARAGCRRRRARRSARRGCARPGSASGARRRGGRSARCRISVGTRSAPRSSRTSKSARPRTTRRISPGLDDRRSRRASQARSRASSARDGARSSSSAPVPQRSSMRSSVAARSLASSGQSRPGAAAERASARRGSARARARGARPRP